MVGALPGLRGSQPVGSWAGGCEWGRGGAQVVRLVGVLLPSGRAA